MPPIARLAELLHLLVVGLWLGALVMGAVVASIIFPSMRELNPHFISFDQFTGNHADLGAGFIQARVFAAVDVVQFVGVLVGLVTLIVSAGARHAVQTKSTVLRSILLGITLLLFGYQFFVLAPRMDGNAIQYWQAAHAGKLEQAESYRAAFTADHPTATRTFALLGVCVLGVFVAGAWTTIGSTACSATGTDLEGRE